MAAAWAPANGSAQAGIAMPIRPRGFYAWRPNGHNVELLTTVKQVLVDYTHCLPLTQRQIFYRLVARFDYEKAELAYKRLGELLANARRDQVVDMDAIRDDGFVARDLADLQGILRDAIESQLDGPVYEQVLRDDAKARQGVLSRLGLRSGGDGVGHRPNK
jgi:hypothetical protein